MNIEQITAKQKENGLFRQQLLILSGDIWKFEGSAGRAAMASLESGECYLPASDSRPGRVYDYYGNVVPFRDDLQPGSKGTLENSIEYWSNH
jgi:hypothetical protein